MKIRQTHAPGFPSSYAVDRRLERRHADEEVTLTKLNTQAMIDAWQTFKLAEPRYNMVDHNCSTVLAVMLQLGSGLEPSFTPQIAIDDHAKHWAQRVLLRLRYFSSLIDMWTPDDLFRYAREIQSRQSVST